MPSYLSRHKVKKYYQELALYNKWINEKVFSAAANLKKEELSQNRGAYFGSIIGTLNHILIGDIFWFKRFADHHTNYQSLNYFRALSKPNSLDEIRHDELPNLWKERAQTDKVILQYMSEIADEEIARTIFYHDTKGQRFNRNLGHLLLHVFNHQTHHRGQVSTLLYQAGIDIGVTDMVVRITDE